MSSIFPSGIIELLNNEVSEIILNELVSIVWAFVFRLFTVLSKLSRHIESIDRKSKERKRHKYNEVKRHVNSIGCDT